MNTYASDRPHRSGSSAAAPAPRGAPYAGPSRTTHDVSAARAGTPVPAPYVPAPFRTQPRLATPGAAPMTEFATPSVAPMTTSSLDSAITSISTSAEAPVQESAAPEQGAESASQEAAAELPWIDAFLATDNAHDSNEAATSSVWAMDDAAREMGDLAAAYPELPTSDVAPSEVAPRSMWSNDDFLDVMPMRPLVEQGTSTRTPAAGGHAASDHSRDPGNLSARADAAAVLERIANDVRDGRLSLAPLQATSDAAVLAAALTALLTRPR